jgi:hypothetical protein
MQKFSPWKYRLLEMIKKNVRDAWKEVVSEVYKKYFSYNILFLISSKDAFNFLKLCSVHWQDDYWIMNWNGSITVAALSKAWNDFTCSNAWIVSSNPTQGIDVCLHLFCVCVVLCVGSGLATGWSPSKESYRLCIGLRNWKAGKIQQRAVEA